VSVLPDGEFIVVTRPLEYPENGIILGGTFVTWMRKLRKLELLARGLDARW